MTLGAEVIDLDFDSGQTRPYGSLVRGFLYQSTFHPFVYRTFQFSRLGQRRTHPGLVPFQQYRRHTRLAT